MKEWVFVFTSLAATGLFALTSHGQVRQLGRMSTSGKVAQASGHCSGGGLLGKFGFHGGCNGGCAAGPSCSIARKLLGGARSGVSEPSCGPVGLGYGGGFGLCGAGDCGGCGVGGYLGRNLHPVNPCACGGSLLGDMARGIIMLVDRTVACVVGGVFGGLKTVTCHASGSFAALQCAAQATCLSCGGGGCDRCSIDRGCGIVSNGDRSHELPTFPSEAPAEATPTQQKPKGVAQDPFLDDPPVSTPQARQLRSSVQHAYYPQESRIGSSVQRTVNRVKTTTLPTAGSLPHRHLQTRSRAVTLRR